MSQSIPSYMTGMIGAKDNRLVYPVESQLSIVGRSSSLGLQDTEQKVEGKSFDVIAIEPQKVASRAYCHEPSYLRA